MYVTGFYLLCISYYTNPPNHVPLEKLVKASQGVLGFTIMDPVAFIAQYTKSRHSEKPTRAKSPEEHYIRKLVLTL